MYSLNFISNINHKEYHLTYKIVLNDFVNDNFVAVLPNRSKFQAEYLFDIITKCMLVYNQTGVIGVDTVKLYFKMII